MLSENKFVFVCTSIVSFHNSPMEIGSKQKRDHGCPRITFHASDRTFDCLLRGNSFPRSFMLIWLTYRTQKTHSRTWKVLLGWSWDSEKMPKLHSLKWKVVLTLLWRMVSPESSSCKHISSQSRYQKVVVSSISVWLLKGFFTSMQRPGNVCLAQWLGILQVWHWQDPAGFKCTYSW